MKMKFVRSGRTNRRELLIAAQRGEALATKEADRLSDDPSALLLGFSYEKQRGGTMLLHYDVEGLWSLRTYLAKRALGTEELMGLLEAVQAVLDLCAEQRLHAEGLLFDTEYVFVDVQCCPHFALIPLDNVPFQTRNSPLALLAAIGDAAHLRFSTPDAEGLSRRLGELVVDLDGVFSINRFRRFLADEQHQGGVPLPPSDDEGLGTGSVWVSAGGGTSHADEDLSGSLFWSPLANMVEPEPESEPASEPAPVPAPAQAPPQPVAPRPVVPPQVPQAPVVPAPQPMPAPQVAPTASPILWLVRPATGERFPLPMGQQVKVGRGSACDIRLLGNRKLSRLHAALTSTGQMLMVSDLGAANGVFVDGQRIGQMQSVLMQQGQRLRLADEEFHVCAE